jgi:hypothetical protein
MRRRRPRRRRQRRVAVELFDQRPRDSCGVLGVGTGATAPAAHLRARRPVPRKLRHVGVCQRAEHAADPVVDAARQQVVDQIGVQGQVLVAHPFVACAVVVG